MQIQLIAVGDKMPQWVVMAYEDYAKRLPAHLPLKLIAIPAEKRGKNADIARLTDIEGKKILAAIATDTWVIALDVQGKMLSTATLAKNLEQWQQNHGTVALLIGGPDGLAPTCLARANQTLSLSQLTLPHPLVRVMVAEQLYRAWSILSSHPYHR